MKVDTRTVRIAAASLLTVAASASAQNAVAVADAEARAAQYVTSELHDAVEREAPRGWLIRQGFIGHANQGSGYSHLIRLDGGTRFLLKGYCDTDCSDLDLELLDRNNNVVLQNLAVDDTPELRFNANRFRGRGYSVRASIPGCTTPACYYSVVLFSR